MFLKPTLTHFVKTNDGQQNATIPWISSDFAAPTVSSLTVLPNGYGLGNIWYDEFGNSFVLRQLKGGTTAALGNVMQTDVPGSDTAAAGSTVSVVNLTGGGLTAKAEIGNFVVNQMIGDGTTGTTKSDVLKLIKDNAAGTLTVGKTTNKYGKLQLDADNYTTAPVAANNLTFVRPNRVKVFDHTQLVELPVGIAVSAVASSTAGNYAMLQVSGLAIVGAKGDVTPWAVDRPIVPDGVTDGLCKGSAALAYGQVGISTQVYSAAAGLGVAWLTIAGYN